MSAKSALRWPCDVRMSMPFVDSHCLAELQTFCSFTTLIFLDDKYPQSLLAKVLAFSGSRSATLLPHVYLLLGISWDQQHSSHCVPGTCYVVPAGGSEDQVKP